MKRALLLFFAMAVTVPSMIWAASQQESGGTSTEMATVSADYGNTGGLSLPLVDEPVTLSMIIENHVENSERLWVFEEITRRTGITVDMTSFLTGAYRDKVNVVIASGDLPDIINIPSGQRKEIGMYEGIVPISDYFDELPNAKRVYTEEYPFVMKSFTAPDGKLYHFPTFERIRIINFGYMYRADVFKQHGIEPWGLGDTEGFYNVLRQLKELYPESYPWASKYGDWIFRSVAWGWGIGNREQFPVFYDERDGKWKLQPATSEYKHMLDFMQKLYREGLLDLEFLTDTSASWQEKMTTGGAFVTYDWIGRMELFRNQVREINPDYDLRYAYEMGPAKTGRVLDPVGDWGPSIANKKNQMAALKLIDYLISPSGRFLVTVGQEGVTFEENEKGEKQYIGFGGRTVTTTELQEKYGLFFSAPITVAMHPECIYFDLSEREQEAEDMMKDHRSTPDPILKFTEDEVETIAELKSSMAQATLEFSSKYLLVDGMGDADWEAWKKEADRIGAQELLAVYNAAQARYDAGE